MKWCLWRPKTCSFQETEPMYIHFWLVASSSHFLVVTNKIQLLTCLRQAIRWSPEHPRYSDRRHRHYKFSWVNSTVFWAMFFKLVEKLRSATTTRQSPSRWSRCASWLRKTTVVKIHWSGGFEMNVEIVKLLMSILVFNILFQGFTAIVGDYMSVNWNFVFSKAKSLLVKYWL